MMARKTNRALCFMIVLQALSLFSCSSSEPLTAVPISPSTSSEYLFSFAIIADTHITGDASSENALRLADCVDWINANETEESIEMAVVVGDIAWGNGLPTAKSILDGLTIPYIPIIGDNVIQNGKESEFDATFSSQFGYLATVFDNWTKVSTPVWNPDLEENSYLQNLSFDYEGIHFMGVDWCSRIIGGMAGEQAELHNFTSGTWPWFVQDVTAANKDMKENIVIFTHHPMHVNPIIPIEFAAFSPVEDVIIETFTAGYGDHVFANFAGHYHIEWSEWRTLGYYYLYVTEATHLGLRAMRLVNVYSDGSTFSYQHEVIWNAEI